MKKEQPMRLAAAAVRFGFHNDPNGKRNNGVTRFRRYILAAEAKSGEQCIIRRGTAKMPRYFVTIHILRQICPELFPKRDEIAILLREQMDKLHEQISELHTRDAIIAQQTAAKFVELDKGMTKLRQDVTQIMKKLGM